MRIVLIGATGMVGEGVLRACLRARDVNDIIVISRRALPDYDDPRLKVFITPHLENYHTTDEAFTQVDACFFCAGVSSLGMSESAYREVTHDLTLHIAQQLLARSPNMQMIYVSGAGADSSEQGKTMWARVRGETENALQGLPFSQVAIFRPFAIIPEDGIQSRTTVYRLMYAVLKPFLKGLRHLAPQRVLTTQLIGDAMLNAVRFGVPHAILEQTDIHRLAKTSM